MHASLPRLGLAGVALALALALPTVAGASPVAGGSWSSPTLPGLNWVSQAWSWLQALLPDVGCGGDPNGQHCGTSAIRPQTGCGGDPSGQSCPGNTPTPSKAHRARGSQAAGARVAVSSGRR